MQTRTQKVKDHFNITDNYLKNNLVVALRSKLLIENLPELKNQNIIDIGCGNGDLTLPYLKENKITFLDLSDKMLEIVRSRVPEEYYYNAEFFNNNIDSFVSNKKFDYLFMVGVLAHVTSLEKTFSTLSRLINKEGTLIIQFTNSKNLISFVIKIISEIKCIFWKPLTYEVNEFSLKTIANVLEQNNLEYYKKISYWPAFPGFILLPTGVRKFIYYKFLNSRMLRPLGGEILLFVSSRKD
jgi:ubiquinone/menaquinone biosynthesis C-methylase UbiE